MAQSKLTLSLDYRVVSLVLAVIVLAMLALWRPWTVRHDADARTVSVTGEATVNSVPDEYVFWPSYQFKHGNKADAIEAATDKTNEVVAKLKELGVQDSAIKTNIDGYGGFAEANENTFTYTGSITVKAADKDLAQKIQDYLVTTGPEGSVTPQPTFSEAKRKQLEAQARDAAIKDARGKADQSAQQLGFAVDKVKRVDDGAGFGGIEPMFARDMNAIEGDAAKMSSPALQPGENDLHYSVTVEYYIR